MTILLDERPTISIEDIENVGVNYTDHLNPGEILDGTPTVEEVGTSDLTITDIAINVESYIEAYGDKDTVEVDHAVVFTLSSLTAGVYIVCVTVATLPPTSTAYTAVPRRFVRNLKFNIK